METLNLIRIYIQIFVLMTFVFFLHLFGCVVGWLFRLPVIPVGCTYSMGADNLCCRYPRAFNRVEQYILFRIFPGD